ncbi:hypothetical protein N9Y92_04095, partial [Chlamydiales bacterium]|nr:hypothetical protein [Chlamydiales bacterium]
NKEHLSFIEPHKDFNLTTFTTEIAYHTRKIFTLEEQLDECQNPQDRNNILFSLIELHETESINEVEDPIIKLALRGTKEPVEPLLDALFELEDQSSFSFYRTFFFLLKKADTATFKKHLQKKLPPPYEERLKWLEIRTALFELKFDQAKSLFESTEASFPFLYGVYLSAVEGKEAGLAFFQDVLENPYPPSNLLGARFLSGKLNYSRWCKNALFWEKKELSNQLSLYYHCINDVEKKTYWENY